MTRYTSFAGTIARIQPFPGGYAIVTAARVPAPVRATFKQRPRSFRFTSRWKKCAKRTE